MKYSEEYRDRELVHKLSLKIRELSSGPATLMEVCGTHTMAVARFGLKSLLPPEIRLVSGPGCPVCVTAQEDIDAFLALGSLPRAILATFGDMMRVPGSVTSLEKHRAQEVQVQVVYAPLDAVVLARNNPHRQVIFFGVGFETTMPATALALKVAASEGLNNFSVFSVHKTMPAALQTLLGRGVVKVDGLLLPGHVTTIIGPEAYGFIPRKFRIPCAVTGFEPVDILWGIWSIMRQIKEDSPAVDNVYTRAVKAPANSKAQALLDEVFMPEDAAWRGLGVIPGSGAALQEEYARFDARRRFAEILARVPPAKPTACRCGEVLRGTLAPRNCPQFDRTCTPSRPLGPCMVSHEGACAAAHKYERG
uniref:Hydrogenase formation protein HypD n=1 Tax=Desulfobacca acetoxidans TaxID=60893 RepID=A0A7C3ZA30_9BACT